MEIRQLEHLEAVLDTGTFTAAAARPHRAPPRPGGPSAPADPYRALHEGSVDLCTGVAPEAHGLEGALLYPVWLVAAGRDVRDGDLDLATLRDRPLACLTRGFGSRVMLEQ